jgi:hypothetical protein
MKNNKEGNVEREYLRKEVISVEEAQEIEPILRSFLKKTKQGVSNSIVSIGEIMKNPSEYRALAKGFNYFSPQRFNHSSGLLLNKDRRGAMECRIFYYNQFSSLNPWNKKDNLHEYASKKIIDDYREKTEGTSRKDQNGKKKEIFRYSFASEDIDEMCSSELPSELLDELKKRENVTFVSEGRITKEEKVFLLSYENWDSGETYLNFSQPSNRDCLVIQYPQNMSLEKTLIRDFVKPKSLGNGVNVYSDSNVPKYLQRRLGL